MRRSPRSERHSPPMAPPVVRAMIGPRRDLCEAGLFRSSPDTFGVELFRLTEGRGRRRPGGGRRRPVAGSCSRLYRQVERGVSGVTNHDVLFGFRLALFDLARRTSVTDACRGGTSHSRMGGSNVGRCTACRAQRCHQVRARGNGPTRERLRTARAYARGSTRSPGLCRLRRWRVAAAARRVDAVKSRYVVFFCVRG